MARSSQKKKSKRGPSTTPPSDAPPSRRDRESGENSRIVGTSILAVVCSLVVSFPPLSPLLTTAAIVRPLLRRVRSGDSGAVTGALWRWALTVFLTILVSAAFVRDRVLDSFPFAAQAARTVEAAISGSGDAPFGVVFILAGFVAFLVLSAVSYGVAGCVAASIALGTAAAGAAVLYTHGDNIVLVTLIALPPWLWALIAAAVVSFATAVAAGSRKLYGGTAVEIDGDHLKRSALIVAGLMVAALLARLLLASPYLSLVRHWTVL
jgi:hypothetical protein